MWLDERKRKVLRAVVEDYVSSGEPVGSRTLARKYGLGVSPATIRNEMADLEELGYLEQPHTSAGRIPSDKGYRFYVDRLMDQARLTPAEVRRIRKTYERRLSQVEWLVHETVKLLSQATQYASVGVGPQLGPAALKSLRAIPIDAQRVLLVLVTDRDFVSHRLVEVPEGGSADSLVAGIGLLSERLCGLTLQQLTRSVLEDIRRELQGRRRILDEVVQMLEESLTTAVEERVYLGGTANILGLPEFRDALRVKALLELLEQEEGVEKLLLTSAEGEVRVVIGGEMPIKEARDFSMVTAMITAHGRPVGRFGVIGPRRMQYARVVAVMSEVARTVAEGAGTAQIS